MFALVLGGLYLACAFGMMAHEVQRHKRLDPVGCLAWPWWFARYSKRMWKIRSAEYFEKANRT